MSERNKPVGDWPYFVTFVLVSWVDLFTRQRYSDIVVESLKFCTQKKGLEIMAYVIMPSHIHCVLRQTSGTLSDVIRDFKAHTAREIIKNVQEYSIESRKDWLLRMFKYHAKFKNQNSEYMVWQKTNKPILIDNNERLERCIDYIHYNPVKSGYVFNQESWVYSSAFIDNPLNGFLTEV